MYFNFGMFPVVLQWFSSRFGAKKGTCKFRVPNSHGKKPWKMMLLLAPDERFGLLKGFRGI